MVVINDVVGLSVPRPGDIFETVRMPMACHQRLNSACASESLLDMPDIR